LSDLPDDKGLHHAGDDETNEIPRQGILSAIPKRTFARVVLLLAALAAIIYLRQRTSLIANCMSDAFRLPPPEHRKAAPSLLKGRVVLPLEPSQKTP